MSELDDLEELSWLVGRERAARKRRLRDGLKCEALITSQLRRCGYPATTLRDGRRVCRRHKNVDWPLAYCNREEPTT